ncbi:hypothetical protein Rhopal_004655-T1 [Rhodotorula paludigena]|uniref:Uncharacterized protein n=1 Tax=Rhodotorula paludigena TaxID=86838 RepID=A0AAV5GQI4_9BASI|nr:hypothetical protein Rhopal_004655-T1 [Rhodotorula paludigena]
MASVLKKLLAKTGQPSPDESDTEEGAAGRASGVGGAGQKRARTDSSPEQDDDELDPRIAVIGARYGLPRTVLEHASFELAELEKDIDEDEQLDPSAVLQMMAAVCQLCSYTRLGDTLAEIKHDAGASLKQVKELNKAAPLVLTELGKTNLNRITCLVFFSSAASVYAAGKNCNIGVIVERVVRSAPSVYLGDLGKQIVAGANYQKLVWPVVRHKIEDLRSHTLSKLHSAANPEEGEKAIELYDLARRMTKSYLAGDLPSKSLLERVALLRAVALAEPAQVEGKDGKLTNNKKFWVTVDSTIGEMVEQAEQAPGGAKEAFASMMGTIVQNDLERFGGAEKYDEANAEMDEEDAIAKAAES